MTDPERKAPSRGELTRRDLLRGLGAAAAAAGSPFVLPSLTTHVGAQPDQAPKRLLLFFTGHGSLYWRWRMTERGGPDDRDWEYDLAGLDEGEFSEILRPLHPFRDKLLVLDTVANVANLSRPSPRGHFGGPSTIFTSSDYRDDDAKQASGPSLDQLVADEIALPGRLRSLEFGRGATIWGGPGNQLPTSRTALSAYRRVFDFLPSPGDLEQPSRQEQIAAGRKSVLDFLTGRYARVAPRLTGQDRARIEAHQAMIRDLERQLSGLAEVTCTAPEEPTDGGGTPSSDVDGFGRVIASAFSCDIARVASLQLPQMRATEFGAPASSDVHQDYAHHGTDAEQQRWMTEYYRTHAEHFATVLGHLDAIPEGDGRTLLDNTIVVWMQECGSWIHQTSHMQCVVAGGGGFRMGRYVHWAHEPIDPGDEGGNVGNRYRASQLGPPHSRLLVSIARQMGLDTNQVGNLSTVQFDGQSFDLRGELDRLV